MALAADEIGVYYNKGHAKEVEAKADHVNAACCLYLVNDTGGSLTSGDVVFLDTDGKVSTTATQGKVALILVVATNHDDTAQTIAAAASGWFQVAQRCPAVTVDGATAIGNWLITSSTVKKAHADSSSLPPKGTFAIAVSAVGGAGSVEAVLLPGFGWSDDDHRAATSNVHGLATDVELVGALEGTARITTGSQSVAASADTWYTTTVNFVSTLPGTPQVVIPTIRKDADESLYGPYMVRSMTSSSAVVHWASDAAGTYYVEVLALYVG